MMKTEALKLIRVRQLARCRLADLFAAARGANPCGAIGIHRLPVGDPRGYDAVAAWRDDKGWMVAAGCRWFTVAEARKHWGEGYKGDRAIGDRYLYALDWLDKQEQPKGEER